VRPEESPLQQRLQAGKIRQEQVFSKEPSNDISRTTAEGIERRQPIHIQHIGQHRSGHAEGKHRGDGADDAGVCGLTTVIALFNQVDDGLRADLFETFANQIGVGKVFGGCGVGDSDTQCAGGFARRRFFC
jgi:hypothetical protein